MAKRQFEGRVEGKVAIVTGAGSRNEGIGNGRASAILLARHGAKVMLVDNVLSAAEETSRMIADDCGGECIAVQCDVTKEAECKALIQQVSDKWQRLDILVNNVGVGGPPGTAVDVDLDAWDRGMEINLKSMVLMSRHAIPEMRRDGSGSIVNIASVAGLRGGHPGLLYPTSKGAIVQLTRAMASHHGTEGIRVNCVAPGMVYTPMVYSRNLSPEFREARRNRSLLKTEGTGWDVGHAVLFLASDEARWLTGVILPVDAGATAGASESPSPTPNFGKQP
jgi:NAD(P)-dependent dehydrogenase (short-subunit alcohol dehydrogenase family)